jgi:hypothetical protein
MILKETSVSRFPDMVITAEGSDEPLHSPADAGSRPPESWRSGIALILLCLGSIPRCIILHCDMASASIRAAHDG